MLCLKKYETLVAIVPHECTYSLFCLRSYKTSISLNPDNFGHLFCFFRFSDLLVGAPRALNRDEGRVFVYVNNKNVSYVTFINFP